MERDRIDQGCFSYEREEPGYLQGILEGYLYMLQTLDDPLTADLYERLHDTGVRGVSTASLSEGIPTGFRLWRDGKEAFQLQLNNTLSPRGYQELIHRYKTYRFIDGDTSNEHFILKEAMENPSKTIDLSGNFPSFIKLRPMRPETCRLFVDYCISIYQQAPKHSDNQKLHAIARLCQDLDQLHVFVDGNIRTSGILLLNRLLIENQLSPCVLRDVNQLDCLSEDEIIELILEGQQFFRSLTHSPY